MGTIDHALGTVVVATSTDGHQVTGWLGKTPDGPYADGDFFVTARSLDGGAAWLDAEQPVRPADRDELFAFLMCEVQAVNARIVELEARLSEDERRIREAESSALRGRDL